MFKYQILLLLMFFSLSSHSRIVTTNKPFDVMLVGKGYFALLGERGSLSFTKDGSFVSSREGYIVDTYGRKLAPGFRIPQNIKSLNISNDGVVDAYLINGEKVHLGKIQLYVKSDQEGYIPVDAFQSPYDLELRQGQQYVKD